MERNEEKKNKMKIEAIIKSEKEKWASLKKHQEEKKLKANKAKYDKFLIQEPNKMRILFLGEAYSGKTCLIKRYIKDEFNPEYITTVAIEAFKSELLFFEDASFRIELIDTPPLENFYKYLDDISYFVQGIIFVFDASNKNSFLRMQNYFKIINFYNFQKIGVIATKKDLCEEKYKYKYYQLEKFCEQYKAICCFISSKNGKEEISKFIDLLCPDIIPSLINKKEDLKLMYPYTKSREINIPKKNMIDEAIIKKAKDEDSSYESEGSKNKEKDKEEEIREYYLKKRKNLEKKKEKMKKNYIYNIGNNINKKYEEDNNSFNFEDKKEQLKDFNNVIGDINIDLEKLFEKYRPESGSIRSGKNKNRNYYRNKKNKTIEEDRDWVNVNIDSLIEEFMNTKTGLKKKNNNKKPSETINDNKKSIKSKTIRSEEKKDKTKSIKESKNSKSKKDEENIKSNISSIKRSKDNNTISQNNDKKSKDKNEDNEDESENNKNESREDEKEKKYSSENKDMEDDEYEDLYRDIYNFQQNAINEAAREKQELEE